MALYNFYPGGCHKILRMEEFWKVFPGCCNLARTEPKCHYSVLVYAETSLHAKDAVMWISLAILACSGSGKLHFTHLETIIRWSSTITRQFGRPLTTILPFNAVFRALSSACFSWLTDTRRSLNAASALIGSGSSLFFSLVSSTVTSLFSGMSC